MTGLSGRLTAGGDWGSGALYWSGMYTGVRLAWTMGGLGCVPVCAGQIYAYGMFRGHVGGGGAVGGSDSTEGSISVWFVRDLSRVADNVLVQAQGGWYIHRRRDARCGAVRSKHEAADVGVYARLRNWSAVSG